jgi:hypothetical protein
MSNSINIITGEVVDVTYTSQFRKIDCVGRIHQIDVTTPTETWEITFEYLIEHDLLKLMYKKGDNTPKISYLHKGQYLLKLTEITSYIIQFIDIDTIEYTSVEN